MTHQEQFIQEDADKLSEMLRPHSNIHSLISHGNLGDKLIHAGTRQLLDGLGVKRKIMLMHEAEGGDLALISGGGAWCRTWENFMAEQLPIIESKYNKVIVLPSSYQMTGKIFTTILNSRKTTFCVREMVSYNLLQYQFNRRGNNIPFVLMHDMAFHYDFSEYRDRLGGNGNGAGDRVLNSYRLDDERVPMVYPTNNNDTSRMNCTLEDWLTHLCEYDIIKTDRAHVMIAAAMIGKMVLYRASNYHKVPAIADFSLKGLPVWMSY